MFVVESMTSRKTSKICGEIGEVEGFKYSVDFDLSDRSKESCAWGAGSCDGLVA